MNHVTDLLPAYSNGTLTPDDAHFVASHLTVCATCTQELQSWQYIHSSMQSQVVYKPTPSLALLDNVFARIDTQPAVTSTPVPSRSERVRLLTAVILYQIRIVHPMLWVSSGVGIAAIVVLILTYDRHLMHPALLSTGIPVIAALGIGFLYGFANDMRQEVVLATPVSFRLIVLGRFCCLFFFNFLLASIGTVGISLVLGRDCGSLFQLWLGPAMLASSLALMITLVFGSIIALAGTGAIWLTHLWQGSGQLWNTITPAWMAYLWQTNPLVVVLACVFIGISLFSASPSTERIGDRLSWN